MYVRSAKLAYILEAIPIAYGDILEMLEPERRWQKP
jgi:hypothetical protein